jgi:hypothetical protein
MLNISPPHNRSKPSRQHPLHCAEESPGRTTPEVGDMHVSDLISLYSSKLLTG